MTLVVLGSLGTLEAVVDSAMNYYTPVKTVHIAAQEWEAISWLSGMKVVQ
jgi:hypothetical protein